MDQLETISEEIRHYFEEVNAARDLAYQRSRELVSIFVRGQSGPSIALNGIGRKRCWARLKRPRYNSLRVFRVMAIYTTLAIRRIH